MKRKQGQPLPLGVTISENAVNFSVAVPNGQECLLLLYKKGCQVPFSTWPMEEAVGEVRFLTLVDIDPAEYEYNYMINGKVCIDPYVKALAGKQEWNQTKEIREHEVRGILYDRGFDWEGDHPLQLPYHEVIAYSLHVRGFTKHRSSGVKHKGTFAGVEEKLPYLKDLGINQIHCMPVYEFEECLSYTNYWGYGEAYCFAPKSSYAAAGDGVFGLKSMVKACHKAGIEVVLEMPFTAEMPKQMEEECLRYYRMEYHVDGFILNPLTAPMDGICTDPILKRTKIMKHDIGFQNTMRRFLKGDEGMVEEVIYRLKRNSEADGIFNYITGHSGFTLNDLVSYDAKHNEANGESNQDGPDYNYSWNCGAEGPSRKKAVMELRRRQMKNAFYLLLTAQGTPCILAGDEFANTQKGNNNVYCQDNPIGWLEWDRLEKDPQLYVFVKGLIELRKNYPVLWLQEESKGIDMARCGMPDVSYHSENAWQIPSEVSSRQLGVYYCGAYADGKDCFVAYNMHWLTHTFALPALGKGKKWYQIASTEEGILKEQRLLPNQRMIEVGERTVIMMMGR